MDVRSEKVQFPLVFSALGRSQDAGRSLRAVRVAVRSVHKSTRNDMTRAIVLLFHKNLVDAETLVAATSVPAAHPPQQQAEN